MHHHSHCAGEHAEAGAIAPTTDTKQTQLLFALCLVAGFAAVESVVGWLSHSLVLIAESGHMASDSLALGLAWLATWLTRSPNHRQIWQHRRLEVWAALVNGLALMAIALWVVWEAIQRLQTPPQEIASLPLLITAMVGAGVNGVNIVLLHRGSDHDLNLRAAFLHVLSDTLSSVGVMVAAIAIAVMHWLWADGAISLLVATMILGSTLPLVSQSAQALRQPPATGLPDSPAITTDPSAPAR